MEYKLKYLKDFEDDLFQTTLYISTVLNNPVAADKFLQKVDNAIHNRLKNPLSFQPYISDKNRKDTYYRIYVGNYTIFYVVIDDIMEVRRLIYSRRNFDRIL